MNKKGYWLLLDALLALFLVTSILFFIPSQPQPTLTQLVVLQKQHDLFKYWLNQNALTIADMQTDVERVFSVNAFELTVGNQAVSKQANGWQPRQTSSQTIRWETPHQNTLIRLTIYY